MSATTHLTQLSKTLQKKKRKKERKKTKKKKNLSKVTTAPVVQAI